MPRLLPCLFFCLGSLSLSAQLYLDSLPLTGPLPASKVSGEFPINVGYGQQDQVAFNGAATHLEASQFNRGQINDRNQLWQALVPGFTVTRPGSNPNEAFDARIRGLRTITGNTQPLYVVDGVPGVDLFSVDPSDIVAVDVLRDAASTAIYGGRGTNGVVLITTRPAETGGLKINYQGQVSVESAAKRYTVQDESQFLARGGIDLSPGFTANTDWQSEVLQTAVSHAHHLAATTGLGPGFLKVGLHYREVTGILRESGFEQYNGNLLTSRRIWKNRLTLSAGATLGQRYSNYGFPDAYRYALSANPSSLVRSDDAQYAANDGYVETPYFDYFNPVAI
ncbi:MAG: TonB-dependent receptor plug domain-containing protein, partial [Saprospiraceae bacterium]